MKVYGTGKTLVGVGRVAGMEVADPQKGQDGTRRASVPAPGSVSWRRNPVCSSVYAKESGRLEFFVSTAPFNFLRPHEKEFAACIHEHLNGSID